MAPDLKRKLEDQSMSNELPKRKKSRLTESPKLSRWTAPDFDQEVYTPFESLLPSPFGKDFQPGEDLVEDLKQFGPVVRTTYEVSYALDNRATVRENLRNGCSDTQILWADPLKPLILKSGEGLNLSQDFGETKTVRFCRVTSEYAFQWFAFVQRGTDLTINGQRFPSARDYVVGPFPGFSIVEYDGRCVFLYSSRAAVDYTPSGLGKHGFHETIYRIVSAFKEKQEHKKSSKGSAGSSSRKTGSSRSEAGGSAAKLRIQPQRQPENVDSCEYFRWRLQEWKTLRDRANVDLWDQAVKYPGVDYQEWLVDSVMFRAIASVTTAIELENGVPFAQIDEASYQQARAGVKPRNYDNSAIGSKGEFLLPFNTDNKAGGSHWLLVHAKATENGPEIHCYNSSGVTTTYDGQIRLALRYSLWYGGSLENQPGFTEITHHRIPRQPAGWECGYFTIMNGWCIALGMKPSTELGSFVTKDRVLDLIDMINLSMSGYMDSATIQAFMRCTRFVDERSDTIADNRHFTRSVPFLSQSGMNQYVSMRRDIEKHPHSSTKRLDVETIRYILYHTGHDDVQGLGAEAILQRFDAWLKEHNLIELEPTSPLSPISPATIRMSFAHTASFDLHAIPVPLPEDVKVLRKVWRVYHRILKRQDALGAPRQARADEKEAGAPSTQESVPRDDVFYPYDDPKVVTLDRLGMLPSTDVLSPTEVAGIRTKKPPVKIRLKATRKPAP